MDSLSTSMWPWEEKISWSIHSARSRSEPSSDMVAPGASSAMKPSRSWELTAVTKARTAGSLSLAG